ncbi:hypothetical protein QTI66_17410 [Variovorax sp. J22R133]|uniref:hypothetical protein n=1 Tax=Variovorax brevis TaxID=3053503 RepID=UPI0025787568|nr:hypothetical protein [Variovorax sp. J22R133]MDM0113936.1 hypothetical protein [Variovorax sp. J22R133]
MTMGGAPRIDLDRLLAPPMNEGLFEESWWNEYTAHWDRWCEGDDATAQCALLAEGLERMERRMEKDRGFQERYGEWSYFATVYQLELLIEQSTDEAGRLLPHELRMMRTYTAPVEWRSAMRELLLAAPKHVLAHLLLWVSMEVRIARARSTGSAHWRPHEADPPEPEPAFRASKFKPRPYGR